MSQHEQDQSSGTSMTRQEESRSIANVMMDTVGGATRLGINLASLPLGLLPRESRDHMRNAIRELSYAFAQLPRDFATIAERPIEEWIARADQPAAPPPAAQAAHAAPATPTTGTAHTTAPPDGAVSMTIPATPAAESTPTPPPATPPAETASAPAEPAPPPPAAEQPPENSPAQQPQESSPAPEARIDKSATGTVEIAFIEYNPIGSDLQGEYVVLRNSGNEDIAMKGWRLIDDAENTFVFPNFTLKAAGEVRVWTKKGRNTRSDLYWGRTMAAWNNTGDTARLIDADGNEVARYQYEVPKNMRRR